MKIYPLKKKVFVLKNNAAAFLNGLTSNSLDKPRNAFLNIHGKIIATFDEIKISDEEVWLVIDDLVVENLFKHLNRYMKLAAIKREEKNINVYFDLEGNYVVSSEEKSIPQKKGQMILTARNLPDPVSDEEFVKFRIQNNIPQQGIDYTDDFLLNISDSEFVSFTKGCYLGQEPVSKVYNRSKPSWKLVVKKENDCSDEEKAKMTSKISGMGFVFVKN